MGWRGGGGGGGGGPHAGSHNIGGTDVISGAGRLAKLHWLDPDASAISDYEFFSSGDLSAFSFDSGISASVSGGRCIIVKETSANYLHGMYLPVSLSGNFYFEVGIQGTSQDQNSYSNSGPFLAVVATGSSTAHVIRVYHSDSQSVFRRVTGTSWPGASGGSGANSYVYHSYGHRLAVARYSGTVYVGAGGPYAALPKSFLRPGAAGEWSVSTAADSTTFDRIVVGPYASGTKESCCVLYLRRYA